MVMLGDVTTPPGPPTSAPFWSVEVTTIDCDAVRLPAPPRPISGLPPTMTCPADIPVPPTLRLPTVMAPPLMMLASLVSLLTVTSALLSFGMVPCGDQLVASNQSLLVPPTQVNVAKPISHHSGAANRDGPAIILSAAKRSRTLRGIRPDQQSTIGGFLATVIIPRPARNFMCCQTARFCKVRLLNKVLITT